MTPGGDFDRFAGSPRPMARLALALIMVLLVAAALVPISRDLAPHPRPGLSGNAAAEKPRDDDLQVYDNVVVRLQAGQGYYAAAAAEHRAIGFPLRPGLAVRLPTLAWIEAVIGPAGERAAAILLLAAVMIAWWRRLGTEPGGHEHRLLAIALLAVGAVLMLNTYFFRLHELWAGMLLALSFGLQRPGRKWGWALAVAALALAIRELALPYVLLMAALALWRGDRREGAAWALLAAVFAGALATHLHLVAAQLRPGDLTSQSWFALRGLSGALENAVFSSNLRLLPHWLAGPLAVLMVLGWAGWRSPAGLFGALLFAGYGVFFAVAGRDENYYWGMLISPCLAMGLAFLPGAARSLLRAAR